MAKDTINVNDIMENKANVIRINCLFWLSFKPLYCKIKNSRLKSVIDARKRALRRHL